MPWPPSVPVPSAEPEASAEAVPAASASEPIDALELFGLIQLENADCFVRLPRMPPRGARLVLTDPPYGVLNVARDKMLDSSQVRLPIGCIIHL